MTAQELRDRLFHAVYEDENMPILVRDQVDGDGYFYPVNHVTLIRVKKAVNQHGDEVWTHVIDADEPADGKAFAIFGACA